MIRTVTHRWMEGWVVCIAIYHVHLHTTDDSSCTGQACAPVCTFYIFPILENLTCGGTLWNCCCRRRPTADPRYRLLKGNRATLSLSATTYITYRLTQFQFSLLPHATIHSETKKTVCLGAREVRNMRRIYCRVCMQLPAKPPYTEICGDPRSSNSQ